MIIKGIARICQTSHFIYSAATFVSHVGCVAVLYLMFDGSSECIKNSSARIEWIVSFLEVENFHE